MFDWKRTTKLLLLIVIVGGVLRFYHLGENSFVADEFLDINSAYGYHQTGEWRAWDFNFGNPAEMNVNHARDERAFLYKWQVSNVFTILPPTEAVARSVSVLWGLLSILVVFWSTWIFTRRRDISLVAALLSAISLSAIIMSRRLRMYAMFFPLYLAAATSFYAAYEIEYQGKIQALRALWQRFGIHLPYLMLGVLMTLISLLVHQLTVHLVLSVGLYLLVRATGLYRRGQGWKNSYGYSIMLGIGGLFIAGLAFPSIFRSFVQGLVFFDDHYSYIGYLFRDFATLLMGLGVTLVGAVMLARRFARVKESLFLGLSLCIPLLMAIFLWRRNAGPQYIYFIQSFVTIFAAVGLVGMFEFMKERWPELGKKGLGILVLVMALVMPNWGYFLEENNTYHETSTGGNPNYRKVFTYVKKEKVEGDVLIARNFRNYYWSGAKLPVFDFGGELSDAKLSLADIQAIEAEHPSGWFVYSGNDEDYISSEVERYVAKNWERVSNANVRGDITVYRFGQP